MNVKLNLDFSLYKGVTKLKQWYKEVKAHFIKVQEAHNALEDTVSLHKSAVVLDHPDKSVTTEKIADRSITRDKLSFDILSEIAKIPEFLYYDVEPVYLSECKESLGYRIPADIPINVLFKLENDTDGSLSEFRTHDDYYTPLSCKIPSGETRICILLKRASGGADPQNGYLFVLDDTDTQKLISKETSERKNADTVLGQRITAEATARENAVAVLDGRVKTNSDTLDSKADKKDMYGGYTVDGSFNDDDFQVQVDSSYSYATVNVKSGKSITINGVQVSLPASFIIKPISPADDVVQVYAEYDTKSKTIDWGLDRTSTSAPYDLYNDILQIYACQIRFEFIYTDGTLVDVTPKVTPVGNISLEITKPLSDLKTENKDSFLDAINENAEKINSTAAELQAHETQTPDTDGGVHGVRAVDGKIEIFDGRNFVEMQKAYKTYGVSIDLTNSDPETAVTYTDDAVGMVAGSSDWDNTNIFRNIRPCLFKDGAVVGYLNTDDFSKFADGTDADITSGDAGDVMIEIPKLGVKIANDGSTLTVQVTDDPNAEGFQYYAHTRQTMGDRDKLYIGAFLGYNLSSALRSLSGKTPTANITIGQARTLAQANGDGYDQIAFYQLTLLQCLYLIKYKNTDSQTALGMGYTASSNTSATQTGGTVAKGMDFGETTGTQQMKFLGVEDFWGNLLCWIDGLASTSDYHVLTATDNFNDDGTGYADQGQMSTSAIKNWMKAPQGTNETGFIIKSSGASSTTYFADVAIFKAGYLSNFGGYFKVGGIAGVFDLNVNASASDYSDNRGGRLMYL